MAERYIVWLYCTRRSRVVRTRNSVRIISFAVFFIILIRYRRVAPTESSDALCFIYSVEERTKKKSSTARPENRSFIIFFAMSRRFGPSRGVVIL